MKRILNHNPIVSLSERHKKEYISNIGPEGPALIIAEECSELIKAVTKCRRTELTKGTVPEKQKQALTEELAHVYMAMQTIQTRYEIAPADINKQIHKSLQRYENGHVLEIE